MLSIANEVDPLIFCCICFVCDTNHVLPIGGHFQELKIFSEKARPPRMKPLHYKFEFSYIVKGPLLEPLFIAHVLGAL